MGVINQLPKSVINRIAAGEVVVRPANAVKELIENSLDAGATEIIINIKKGGLELLQDNGKGFLKDDLELACVRFATSKLHEFDDLHHMQTYGFRGEALASISLVSKVTITSRSTGQPCAYVANYDSGKMVSLRASAGNQGTCIVAEEMFSDATARRQSMKPNEEASRVEDVVIRYAVHRSDVSFALRGGGSAFRTKGDGNRLAVISALIGSDIAKNMIDLNYSSQQLKYRLTGNLSEPISIATASGEQAKKTRRKFFFLFINGRSVKCAAIRLMLDALFSERDLICPFTLLSLELQLNRVDVNAHPTKEEVIFLEEEAIVEDIKQYISSVLSSTTEQQLAHEAAPIKNVKVIPVKRDQTCISNNGNNSGNSLRDKEKRIYEHSQVRTDHLERRLHAFSTVNTLTSNINEEVEMVPVLSQGSDNLASPNLEKDMVLKRDLQLESVHNMKKEICAGSSQSLRELFKEHIFVGCVDPERLLIQHGTSLYALDLKAILEEYFYQVIVFGFGNLGCFKLEEPIKVAELYYMALKEIDEENNLDAVEILFPNAEMLQDYLSITLELLSIDDREDLYLTGIPSLVNGFLPQLEGLPHLVKELVEAPWNTDEETCLKALCHAAARFFVVRKEFCCGDNVSGIPDSAEWLNLIRDYLLPRIQQRLIPQEKFKTNDIIVRVVDQYDMYSVFERC